MALSCTFVILALTPTQPYPSTRENKSKLELMHMPPSLKRKASENYTALAAIKKLSSLQKNGKVSGRVMVVGRVTAIGTHYTSNDLLHHHRDMPMDPEIDTLISLAKAKAWCMFLTTTASQYLTQYRLSLLTTDSYRRRLYRLKLWSHRLKSMSHLLH